MHAFLGMLAVQGISFLILPHPIFAPAERGPGLIGLAEAEADVNAPRA
jgi:hypothetical protein